MIRFLLETRSMCERARSMSYPSTGANAFPTKAEVVLPGEGQVDRLVDQASGFRTQALPAA